MDRWTIATACAVSVGIGALWTEQILSALVLRVGLHVLGGIAILVVPIWMGARLARMEGGQRPAQVEAWRLMLAIVASGMLGGLIIAFEAIGQAPPGGPIVGAVVAVIALVLAFHLARLAQAGKETAPGTAS